MSETHAAYRSREKPEANPVNWKQIIFTAVIGSLMVAGVQRLALNDRLKDVEARTREDHEAIQKLESLPVAVARIEATVIAIKEDQERRLKGGQ